MAVESESEMEEQAGIARPAPRQTGSVDFQHPLSRRIEFNYNQVRWETGDASGGTDGLGGTSAAVGYSDGLTGASDIYYQLNGSLVNGALIDGGPDALITTA